MRLILELLPLIAFFVSYKNYGIEGATIAIIIATAVSVALHFIFFKKVSKSMIVSFILVTVMGIATIVSGSGVFIKMKPTVLSIVIAAVVLYGLLNKKYYVKLLFGHVFPMSDEAWIILSRRVFMFFLLMAGLNELIWRAFSESTWVSFKVFGVLPIFLVFMILQLPLFNKYSEKKAK